jgi:hypothetical protein
MPDSNIPLSPSVSQARTSNVLSRFDPDQPASAPSSRPWPDLGPVVFLSVSAIRLAMPEHALSVGLSDLLLRTEGHVPLADYAEGVGLVLGVLAKLGVIDLGEKLTRLAGS